MCVLGEADASYTQQEEVEACIQSAAEDLHGGLQAAGIDRSSTRQKGAVLEFTRMAGGGAAVLLSITQPCQVSKIVDDGTVVVTSDRQFWALDK